MIRRQRSRSVVLALAACAALFWGAVDIVGVSASRLLVQLGWVSVGVVLTVLCAAAAGWVLNKWRRTQYRRSSDERRTAG